MKYLKIFSALFLCFISTVVFSQRDFDYTFYTFENTIITYNDSLAQQTNKGYDTLNLTYTRKFIKDGGKLRQVSIFNTGALDITYDIEYVGFSRSKHMFHYMLTSVNGKPKEDMSLYIDPITPLVIFVSKDYESIYE